MTTFAFNLAAIKLAEALHHAMSEAYGVAIPSFESLSPREKQDLVEIAGTALEAVKPVPVYQPDYFGVIVGHARREAANVIGRIGAAR